MCKRDPTLIHTYETVASLCIVNRDMNILLSLKELAAE